MGPLPAFLLPAARPAGTVLEAEGLAKAFGGIHAVEEASLAVADRTLHALIGPNGAGKTTLFNLVSGCSCPIAAASCSMAATSPANAAPHCRGGLARSFQITNLFRHFRSARRGCRAGAPYPTGGWTPTTAIEPVQERTRELIGFLGLTGIEQAEAGALSYGGQRLLDMGLALAPAPRALLLDEPLAGLAAAERERVAGLVKRISRDIPVLLVEHDIDRVFALADRVTVMNEGRVLVDGTADDARNSRAVQDYIGVGTAALAAGATATPAAAPVRNC
jgi:ABC-type branched-subunit amino acid transport system ATPase component